MVKFVRIDDRLIHGQVAYTWSRYLGINCILIANDSVVNDQFRKMSLNIAKPSGITLLIKKVDDAIKFLKSQESLKLIILVLVDNSSDALKLSMGVDEIKSINVGGMRMKPGKRMISKAVSVDDSDISNFTKLYSMGIEVEIRQVPTEKKSFIKDLLKLK